MHICIGRALGCTQAIAQQHDLMYDKDQAINKLEAKVAAVERRGGRHKVAVVAAEAHTAAAASGAGARERARAAA